MSGFQTGFVASGYSRWPNITAWGVVGRVAEVKTDPEPCPPQRTLKEGRPGVIREKDRSFAGTVATFLDISTPQPGDNVQVAYACAAP